MSYTWQKKKKKNNNMMDGVTTLMTGCGRINVRTIIDHYALWFIHNDDARFHFQSVHAFVICQQLLSLVFFKWFPIMKECGVVGWYSQKLRVAEGVEITQTCCVLRALHNNTYRYPPNWLSRFFFFLNVLQLFKLGRSVFVD